MWMWSTGINRNIVECKVRALNSYKKSRNSINRNIVECKAVKSFIERNSNRVLIETLWNVK